MHLKELILTGFKSFVDRTVASFPSNLVAVLGPNGCGKSNIIDAVTWVLGESSPKRLRGESMSDVIFNGSTNRKPVGQASVELVFDNSMGRVIGPFASYGEISIKRVVTRDGESQYFINGGRCRRKDVTDIFLGTGAGARSYSIIGQGTISRIIEAKPEELRGFLEEAAGVSKYKERRKETLSRIEHTRENLTRVADIRNELDLQLQRLQRQAKAAERYTVLKQEEHLCRAQIMALKWHEFTQAQLTKQSELQKLRVRQEEQQALVTSSQTARTLINEQINELTDQTQTVQNSLYQVGTEIARLEQNIQQQDREQKRLQQDNEQLQIDYQQAQSQLQQDKEELALCEVTALTTEEKVKSYKEEFAEQEEKLQQAQTEQRQWETHWQDLNSNANNTKTELELTQLNLRHNEESQHDIALRIEKIKAEQASISIADLENEKQELQIQQEKLQETQAFDEQHLQDALASSSQLRTEFEDAEKHLHQLQDQFHNLNSEHAALIAAQKAAVQANKNIKEGIREWADKPRLMNVLKIETKWQAVCDIILHDCLHAYVLENFDGLMPQWDACKKQGESVVTLNAALKNSQSYPTLADKIEGMTPASMYNLSSIYTADSLEQAMSWLPNIKEHESIVIEDGCWFGKGWAKFINASELDETGFLARQQKIEDLATLVQKIQQDIESTRTNRDELHAKLQEALRYNEIFQLNLNSSNEAIRTNITKLTAIETSIINTQKHAQAMTEEWEELQIQIEDAAEKKLVLREKLELLEQQYQQAAQLQQQYLNEKQAWLDKLSALNMQVSELRSLMHQAELTYDRELAKSQQYQDRINREQNRLQQIQDRIELIADQSEKAIAPMQEFKRQLEELLGQHSEIETRLSTFREQLSQQKIKLDEQDKFTLNYEHELRRVYEHISENKMQEQELAVRASAVQESLDELGLQAKEVITTVEEGKTQSTLEDDLISLTQKIKNLGAINLAAIEEFATEEQRKIYLDDQYNDLNEALLSLESAIEKMDKETRLRLEDTFNQVNATFTELFPRLFGGGRAQLELTCDNLLEAGIVVMAQPPGKRNSTIHLLSGGEKAMTAVALVFAIFRLNPSPFCMLDEVDAPLDDVNVGRFCDLVREMSEFIQFVFITHNKVTMEMADQLIGVTMREPGVSRLVAVDVKQALLME